MKPRDDDRFHIWPAPASHQPKTLYIEDHTGKVARYRGTLHTLATESAWWPQGRIPDTIPNVFVYTPACPICRRQKEARLERTRRHHSYYFGGAQKR